MVSQKIRSSNTRDLEVLELLRQTYGTVSSSLWMLVMSLDGKKLKWWGDWEPWYL